MFPVLPPLAWSVHKKPIMASRVTTAATGRENQLACAAYPRWHFTLTYGGDSWLRDATQNIVPDPDLAGFEELRLLSGLFLKCLGSYGEFYYEDPDDNSRLNQFNGVGDATITNFALSFFWGDGPYNAIFSMPVGGIKTIDAVYWNGAVQSPSTYSMDATNTVLVFTSPPGRGVIVTVDFHFYFRCRWSDDHIEFSQWAKNLWENKETRFESVKP